MTTCPEAIATALEPYTLTRAGLETGPLSVWLWNGLKALGVAIICMDARHANAALKMMPAKTHRNDARRLSAASVLTELVVVPGAYHGFDVILPDTNVAKRFVTAKVEALRQAFTWQTPERG